MELFLDMWVDRWASFRFSFSKASSPHGCESFSIDRLSVRGEMHRLMLIMCTKLTVNGGLGVGEEKDFDAENGVVKVFHGFSVNQRVFTLSCQKQSKQGAVI